MTAPKYIQAKAKQLHNAMNLVAQLAGEIEEWVGKHDGVDGSDFFYENKLDMVYEYDLGTTLRNLDLVESGEYESWS